MMRFRLRHEKLQELIAARNLSQNHWAMKLGLSRGHWSDIVNGKHPYPSAKTRQRLVETFNVPSEELFVVESGAGGKVQARLPDRYVVDREVGQGGMGTVYLARDVALGRQVAIKIVSSEAVGGIGAEQLLREIRYTARLHHPHILPLHDAGTVGSSPYYVMPFVSDGSLAERLERTGRLSLNETLDITRGIAAALAFAHQHQVLHCDIKPGNVLLCGTHAYVADFGLARAIHLEALEWGRPQEIDSSAGTPAYVSPELASGEPRLDPRSDVYSLACVVFEMLTGRPAFSGRTSLETVAMRFSDQPPDPRALCPEIPPAVARIVRQGMSCDGARRFHGVSELCEALERAARSASVGSGQVLRRLGAVIAGTGRRVLRSLTGAPPAAPPAAPRGKVQRMIFSLRQDMVYALQAFRRAPVFTAVVVLSLAFGIGANTQVFSVVNSYFLRPLPFAQPAQLVQVGQVDPVSGFDMMRFSLPQLRDYRERSNAFEQLAAYSYGGGNLTGGQQAERVSTGLVTADLFSLLGVSAVHGRTFLPEEGGVDGGHVVVLDHGFWQRRFAGSTEVLGQSLTLDGETYTVVGVMPAGFVFPFGGIDLWLPIEEDPAASREHAFTLLVGRLTPGWTLDRARQELDSIHEELARVYPEVDGKLEAICVKPLRQALNFAWDILLVSFTLMMVTVFFVLLIVCVNVSILMLARGTARSSEMALRAALGAGRRRLLRQLMTENALLAAAGAVLGIALATVLTRLTMPLIPQDLYRVGDATVDGTVLAFTFAVTVATLLLFGLAPALAATRSNLGAALREGGGGTGRKSSLRLRRGLVVLEIAVAVLLISGVGLAARSLLEVRNVDLGFATEGVTTCAMAPPSSSYPDQAAVDAYFERVVTTVQALPGVNHTATADMVPQNHEEDFDRYTDPSSAPADLAEWPVALLNRVSPGYFAAMGINLLSGRDLQLADREGGQVAVVSQSLAKNLWPEQSAIGRTLLVGGNGDGALLRVVGVVGNVMHRGILSTQHPQIYRPQTGSRRRYLVVATAGSSGSPVREVRSAVQAIDSDVPVTPLSMQEIVGQNVLPWSITTLVLAINSGTALLLAIFGIYGVVAYSVAQQRRHIGIRMALGATPQLIRGAFVLEGLKLSAFGIVSGLGLAMVANRVAAAALYGVGAFDAVTFGLVAAVFVAVTVLSSLVPATRASRVEPIQVLRYE